MRIKLLINNWHSKQNDYTSGSIFSVSLLLQFAVISNVCVCDTLHLDFNIVLVNVVFVYFPANAKAVSNQKLREKRCQLMMSDKMLTEYRQVHASLKEKQVRHCDLRDRLQAVKQHQ